jgi:hypothetical protein
LGGFWSRRGGLPKPPKNPLKTPLFRGPKQGVLGPFLGGFWALFETLGGHPGTGGVPWGDTPGLGGVPWRDTPGLGGYPGGTPPGRGGTLGGHPGTGGVTPGATPRSGGGSGGTPRVYPNPANPEIHPRRISDRGIIDNPRGCSESYRGSRRFRGTLPVSQRFMPSVKIYQN